VGMKGSWPMPKEQDHRQAVRIRSFKALAERQTADLLKPHISRPAKGTAPRRGFAAAAAALNADSSHASADGLKPHVSRTTVERPPRRGFAAAAAVERSKIGSPSVAQGKLHSPPPATDDIGVPRRGFAIGEKVQPPSIFTPMPPTPQMESQSSQNMSAPRRSFAAMGADVQMAQVGTPIPEATAALPISQIPGSFTSENRPLKAHMEPTGGEGFGKGSPGGVNLAGSGMEIPRKVLDRSPPATLVPPRPAGENGDNTELSADAMANLESKVLHSHPHLMPT
jgi:hypothetical protein